MNKKAWLLARIMPPPKGAPRGRRVTLVAFDIFSEDRPTAMNDGVWATILEQEGEDYADAVKKLLKTTQRLYPWIVQQLPARLVRPQRLL